MFDIDAEMNKLSHTDWGLQATGSVSIHVIVMNLILSKARGGKLLVEVSFFLFCQEAWLYLCIQKIQRQHEIVR